VAADSALCASRHRPRACEHIIGLSMPIGLDKFGGNMLAAGIVLFLLSHYHTDHLANLNMHFCGGAPPRVRRRPASLQS